MFPVKFTGVFVVIVTEFKAVVKFSPVTFTGVFKSIDTELVVSNKLEKLFEPWDIIFSPSLFIENEYLLSAKQIIYGPHCFLFPVPPWQNYSFSSNAKYLFPSQWAKEFVDEIENTEINF